MERLVLYALLCDTATRGSRILNGLQQTAGIKDEITHLRLVSVGYFYEVGLCRGWVQELAAEACYRPDFTLEEAFEGAAASDPSQALQKDNKTL